MTWTTKVQLSPSGGGYTTHHYRANGPYDPDTSLGGGTPRHWNYVTQGWKKYVVLGSKITAQFLPTSQQDTAIPGFFTIVRTHDTALTYTGIAELKSDGHRIISTGPTETTKRMAKTFSLQKTTGSRASAADDEYQALTSGLPATQQYFHLVAGAIGSSVPTSMFFLVTIDYIIKFFDNNPNDG